MERKAFTLLLNGEHTWWYRGRANVIDRVLRRFVKKEILLDILDIGAGWGGMLATLQPYGKVTALEPDAEARRACEARGYDTVLDSDIPKIREESYDLVALFDVLEHTPDDAEFLTYLYHILRDKGQIVLTVPAYQWLFSAHDIAHHHYRRYTRTELSFLLERSGFTVTYASYWNMSLLFPAALLRIFGVSGESSFAMPSFLDKIFFILVSIESLFIPLFGLPFGMSIVVFAEKQKIANENL